MSNVYVHVLLQQKKKKIKTNVLVMFMYYPTIKFLVPEKNRLHELKFKSLVFVP